MNENAFQKICELLTAAGVEYAVYTHPECRTSEESARVRRGAGMPDAIGAKALLCKVDFRSSLVASEKGVESAAPHSEFVVFVLPGTHALDKAKLKLGLPELKQFRFSTQEELMDIAGVVPGCMPPFGNQLFPKVSRTYVSSALKDFPRVAFNAAKLDTSITLKTEDYLATVISEKILDFSTQKQNPA